MSGISPRTLFLIDAIGALVSTLLLGFVLPYFHALFGLPKPVLWLLASIAFIFFVYSFWCYINLPQNRVKFLKLIAIGNLSYCVLTIYVLIHFWQNLTLLGRFYFILELMVIAGLVLMEFKISSRQ